MRKNDLETGMKICDYCGCSKQKLAGTPYLADGGALMCLECYKFTYAGREEEALPFNMIARVYE